MEWTPHHCKKYSLGKVRKQEYKSNPWGHSRTLYGKEKYLLLKKIWHIPPYSHNNSYYVLYNIKHNSTTYQNEEAMPLSSSL